MKKFKMFLMILLCEMTLQIDASVKRSAESMHTKKKYSWLRSCCLCAWLCNRSESAEGIELEMKLHENSDDKKLQILEIQPEEPFVDVRAGTPRHYLEEQRLFPPLPLGSPCSRASTQQLTVASRDSLPERFVAVDLDSVPHLQVPQNSPVQTPLHRIKKVTSGDSIKTEGPDELLLLVQDSSSKFHHVSSDSKSSDLDKFES